MIIIKDERGMTLIEVLVALVILTIAMVTMMNGFFLGGRQNANTNRYNIAMTLAQSKMEEIKKLPYKNIVNVASTNFSAETDYSQYTGFSYIIAVENDGLNVKKVTVTVSYSDEGTSKTFALTSGIAKR